ncbi:hypothetical protein HLRTI_002729 [Halorhabdus tiamatea SARL4B]|uniref:DUF1684 domain-containing protein n=1 Tax=Halorhabdus tiamatea SARL4B TaxID=1033806 RepID=U2DH00_9EURY|nr:DUF1684 domain-containing protein [Halorhabdus tiamatea]ERJ05287.1 hypothetical protein HLRTI_002729 [Halorhabdus tiamatea SARL4B]
MTDENYAERIREQRAEKETYFAEHPRSPFPGHADFEGLDHYPVDPAYRYELPLEEHDEKESVTVETTADGSQEYVRWGEFNFEIDGESVTLQAYKPASGEDRFWVPFRDETNDEETYGAGRYLDLEPDRHQTADGTWILDLNQAYNPTCAYNEAYECPLIPMENWLDVPVEAGEKAYPGEAVGHEPSH